MSKYKHRNSHADVSPQHMLTTITNWRETIAANMILLRRCSGMSQRQLAAMLGVSAQVVEEYERAEKEPSVAHLTHLSNFFGFSVYDLLTRKITPEEAAPRHLGNRLWDLVCAAPSGASEQLEMLEKHCHHMLNVCMMDLQEKAPIDSISIGELIAPGYAACAVKLKDGTRSVSGLLSAADHGLMVLSFASEERENTHYLLVWQASYLLRGIATRAVLLECVAFPPLQPHATNLWLQPRIRS